MNLNHALAARTDFSIGESMLQVDDLIATAKEKGYESVTLMDTMSIHALVDFTNRCLKEGMKPIIGCRIRVVADPTYHKPSKASGETEKPNPMYFLKVYIKDDSGVKSLLKLLSKANSEEYFYYHSRVGLEDVLALEGVAVSTGDLFSVWHMPDANEIVDRLAAKFETFVEYVPIDTPLFDTLNAKALAYNYVTEQAYYNLVTYPIFYKSDGQAESLDVLKCITSNTQMDAGYRSIQFVKDFYIHEPDHLVERVKATARRLAKWHGSKNVRNLLSGLQNIQLLVDKCNYKFSKQPVSLPKMAENEFVALGKKCVEGWRRRFDHEVLGYKPSEEQIPIYKERLAYEMSVLKKMGFSGYFLLVEDLVTWAKSNGIIVGPGRGSVGGSLVAYLIGITDVDPVRFDLLFERFINPDRIDLPDADLDFMSSKRHMVIEYLIEKYGADRVAGISNFSTLASASALRDTGRVYGLSGFDLTPTKLVPKEHGQSFTLTEAARMVPELERFRDTYEEIWGHALHLEGAMRSFGRHAAGVVVAGEPLIERAVIETRSGTAVTNWDKRTVEDWGLVKMDILGLSTLDVLEIAKQYIKERHRIDIDYLRVPFEEKKIMEAFGRGDTTGVFQFESSSAKGMLREMAKGGLLTFEDIFATTSLNRPGPLDAGLADRYIGIKRGDISPEYAHDLLKPALAGTFGVMVYQEQIMQICRDLAGFSMPDSDGVRKAIGKKDMVMMESYRKKFTRGSQAGAVDVLTDDGRTVRVNRATLFKVKEVETEHTIEEVIERGFSLQFNL